MITTEKTLLITGGCSFSYARDPHTWPNHLRDRLGIPLLEYSMGSQGNDLIARNIEYAVDQALTKLAPKDILVCVMWSGSNRAAVRPPPEYRANTLNRGMIENPTGWIEGVAKPWVIMNQHFEDRLSKIYYRYFYSHEEGLIKTLEHILRTQWMLKCRGIDYLMTQFSHNVLPRGPECVHPEIAYLDRHVDRSHWLPVESEYEWCRDHSGLPFPRPGDDHPGLEQHEAFTNRVIIPHLAARGIVNQSD
jgi:hypothetical protein